MSGKVQSSLVKGNGGLSGMCLMCDIIVFQVTFVGWVEPKAL